MVKIIKQASSVCVDKPDKYSTTLPLKRSLMCEGPSYICGPIPPDPSFFPEFYGRPASARARLEGNQQDSLPLFLGPLAPDPGLHPESYSARPPTRPPHINPNAAYILERGQRGLVGELLRLDSVSLMCVPKHKKKVHDFQKDNVCRLREIQRRCKELEAVKAQSGPVPVKALWTSPKYQNVPSKFMTQPQVASPTVKPECQNFLKGHSASLTRTQSKSQSRPPSVSSLDQDEQLQVKGQTINFVRLNAQAAGKTSLQRSQSLTNLTDKPVPSAVIGKVPHYIKQRKKQWQKEEEERKKNALDPSAPPGHSLMAECDRVETLRSLKQAHSSLITELLSLPLGADTLSVQSRRTHLDSRLSEIEEAIKVFSRDKVFVKNNA
ncbi:enkurin domain-containing protein 1 [Synchiropus splendidus]|uniref:enkurin domain-containing protein 1 n=1 Tax=Synchiropus splendidus TaxID=270530 RepID=UPI00237D70E1|nr:enkurin domain-containing protein 1 [Synchiropus splendidus]